ncbi:MAG: TIM barrel protein [Nakamurella sp.]
MTLTDHRFDVNLSMLFTELPLLERPSAAAAAGFTAIEFWWPFTTAVPTDTEVDAFARAITDAGVQLVGLNFFAGDMPGGDRGLVSWPARRGEFRDNIDVTVGLGTQLGCTAFNALYGNRVEGSTPAEQDALAAENIALAAAAAAKVDATILVEPVSGAPRYPLRTAAEVVDVLDRVRREAGATNVQMLCDLYHLDANGDDVAAAIATHAGRIGHVQIADNPGRHEPGTGNLDLNTHLESLRHAGYDGYIGLEYKPATTTLDSFDWLPREQRASSTTPTQTNPLRRTS